MNISKTEKRIFQEIYKTLDQMDEVIDRMEKRVDILDEIAEQEEREQEGTSLSLV